MAKQLARSKSKRSRMKKARVAAAAGEKTEEVIVDEMVEKATVLDTGGDTSSTEEAE